MKTELNTPAVALMQGEEVLWRGSSAPFRLLEGTDGRRVALGMTATLAIFPLLILHCGNRPLAAVFLTLVMAVLLLSPVLAWNTLRHQQYWITDRRILSIRQGSIAANMALADLDRIALQPLRPGVSSLVLGSRIISEDRGQLRWRSIHPLAATPTQHIGVVLYSLEQTQEALDLLRALTGVTAA